MPVRKPFKKGGMFDGANHLIFEMAKDLRKNMTEAEKILWFYLKQRPEGFKFRRQYPLGIYIADFYCHKAKLVIELDGTVHNDMNVKKMMKFASGPLKKVELQFCVSKMKGSLKNYKS